MFSELEKEIDAKIETEKAMNKAFHDGNVRVSKNELRSLLKYNTELYRIALMLFDKLPEVDDINETCGREGARILIKDYHNKHVDLINKVALEKLSLDD
jgi:hypothetical protein